MAVVRARLQPVAATVRRLSDQQIRLIHGWATDLKKALTACATVAAPVLLEEPREAARLEQALRAQTDAFVIVPGGWSTGGMWEFASGTRPAIFPRVPNWRDLDWSGPRTIRPAEPDIGPLRFESYAICGCTNPLRVRRRLGARLVEVSRDEPRQLIEEVPRDAARDVADQWLGITAPEAQPEVEDLVAVAGMYLALRGLVQRHNASAVTMSYTVRNRWRSKFPTPRAWRSGFWAATCWPSAAITSGACALWRACST